MRLSTTENLTGAIGVGLRWRLAGGGVKITSAGTVTIVSAGQNGSVVDYEFAVGETANTGLYEVEVTSEINGKPSVVPGFGFGLFRIAETIE